MMDFLLSIYNNKLLFYGIIVVIGFIVFSIFLVKRIDKENGEEETIDYERIDGEDSLFDEAGKPNSEISDSDGKLDLEVMIEKMQKDLDAKASEVIEQFETEQEEKSVISYQELVGEKLAKEENKETLIEEVEENKNAENKQIETFEENSYNNEDFITDIQSDENNNPKEYYTDIRDEKLERLQNILDIDEVNDIDDNINTNEEFIPYESPELHQKDNFVSALKTGDYDNEQKGKFKSTDFVSPIYGVQDINIKYPTVQNMKEFKQPARNYNKFELEQTLNIKPLSDEIKQNEAFLEALKEFRKNLE